MIINNKPVSQIGNRMDDAADLTEAKKTRNDKTTNRKLRRKGVMLLADVLFVGNRGRTRKTKQIDNVASVLLLAGVLLLADVAGVADSFSPSGWWAQLARVLYALYFSLSLSLL